MLKWLRRYNRYLLAGLVVLLMVAFLIQDTFSGGADSQRVHDWGEINGEMVQTDLLDDLIGTRRILTSLGLLDFAGLPDQQFAVLLYEARRSGIGIADAEIETFLSSVPQQRLDAVRRDLHIKLDRIKDAVADLRRIERRAYLMTDVIHVSDDEVRHHIRDTQERARIAYVAFPAEKFVDETAPLDEKALEQQFNKYRDKPAGGREFGYRHPRRIMIEYLSARPEDLVDRMSAAEEKLWPYYQAHKADFMREEPATQPATLPATATAPVAVPATRLVKRQLTFNEARQDVEKAVKLEAARTQVRTIMDRIATELNTAWDSQARGEDGYAARPPGVDAPGYLEKLSQQFTQQHGFPITHEKTALLSDRDLSTNEALKDMQSGDPGVTQMRLLQYAFRVQGLFDATKANESVLSLALFQPSYAPFFGIDERGRPDRFIVFRVAEARKDEAPANLSEVREQVVKDLRLIAAEKAAEEAAQRIYGAARIGGLAAALDADPALKARLSKPEAKAEETEDEAAPEEIKPLAEPPAFARKIVIPFRGIESDTFIPGLPVSKPAVDAAFDMGLPGWRPPPSTHPAATQLAVPATQPSPKVRLVSIPEVRARVVLELREITPVREDEYRDQRETVRATIESFRKRSAFQTWFNGSSIQLRNRFRSAEALARAQAGGTAAPAQ